jgi:tetratricopeptide (TPR) repeat protein
MKKIPIVYLIGLLIAVGATVATPAEQAAPASGEAGSAQAAAEQKAQEEALAAQKNLAIQYIAKNGIAQADAAVSQLLSRFSGQAGLPQAVYEIARKYDEVGNNAKADRLYRQVIAQWHETEWAINSQREIIRACIKRQDAPATQAALDTLLTNFAKHEYIARTIYNLGKYYNSLNNSEMAAKLHQYNVEHYAPGLHAMWSQVEIVKGLIRTGNDAAVDVACNKLVSVFAAEKTLPKEVFQFGVLYDKQHKPDKAKVFYQYVLDHWSDSEYAIRAALAILDSQPDGANTPAAKATFDKLLAAFSQQKTPAEEIYKLARDYSVAHKDTALKLHQFNSRNSPKEDKYAMWSQTEVAKAYIRDGNEPAAAAAVNDLIGRFSDQAGLPTELVYVGDTYVQAQRYDQANQLYQYILGHWPGKEEALWAKAGTARVSIARGDDQAVDKALQEMIAGYPAQAKLGEVVNSVALAYYERAYSRQAGNEQAKTESYQKAIGVWGSVIRELPQSPAVAEACYHSAVVYGQELGERDRALQYYQQVAESWPDYEHAWHAQFSVGDYYQKRKRDGTIPADQADAQIVKAYTTVIEKYPGCRYAGNAALRLSALLYEKGQWVEAAKYMEWLLEKQPPGSQEDVLGALFHLALVYQRMGEGSAAEQARKRFAEVANPGDSRIETLNSLMQKEVQK